MPPLSLELCLQIAQTGALWAIALGIWALRNDGRSQARQVADQLGPAGDRLADLLARAPNAPAEAAPAPPPQRSWKERWRLAKATRDVPALLDLHADAATWPAPRRERAERQLGRWLCRYFQEELRHGRAEAALPAMERAVAALPGLPEIEPLAQALPFVRQSAALRAEAAAENAGFDDWDDDEPAAPPGAGAAAQADAPADADDDAPPARR